MGSFLDRVWEIVAQQGQKDRADQPPPKMLKESVVQGGKSPYSNYDGIRDRIKTHVEQVSKSRWQFERLWFQCVLYYIGNQWIRWDESRREWRQRNLKRKWVPKPVTNRLASTVDAIRGALASSQVKPSAWPASDSVDDIATTAVAEDVVPVIDDEIYVDRIREELAGWITIAADAFALPYYDLSDNSLGNTLIPSEKCLSCGYIGQPDEFEAAGKCPQCGVPPITEPATDEQGQPVTKKYPIGRMRVDVMPGLEVYMNLDSSEFRDIRKWTRLRTYTLDSVKYRYPEAGKKVQGKMAGQTKQAQHYLELIKYMTQNSLQSSTRSQMEHVGIYTHFEMPSEEFPEGLLCVMSDDDVVLEVGPSPFSDEIAGDKSYYNPLVQFGFQRVPGRMYHRTPTYDLISKQDQRNRLESLMELSVMKGVYNTWLLPTGSSIAKITGEPSQIIRWTPSGTGGAKPEVVTTDPFTVSVFQWLEKLDSDFEELGGSTDALKGQTPKGVSAGYAIQLLTERSFGRLGPVFQNWEFSWTQLYKNLLSVYRKNVTEPRLAKTRGDSGAWEIKKFIGADLRGAVDIRIQGGSSKPRSKLAEQALIESLVKLQVLNPAQDPQQKFQLAELFGMSHVLGSQGDDYREAAREWDAFLNGKNPAVLPTVDNHMVHLLDHQKRAKSDTFRSMPEQQQNFWLLHIQDHMIQLAPPPEEGKNGKKPGSDAKPAGSKANEKGDGTVDQIREGGSVQMGADGKNQYGG